MSVPKLSEIIVSQEQTPDGRLSTFQWDGESDYTAIPVHVLDDEPYLIDYLLPWELEKVGECDSGIGFYGPRVIFRKLGDR